MRYKKNHVDNIVAARGPRVIGLRTKSSGKFGHQLIFFCILVLPLLAYSLDIKVDFSRLVKQKNFGSTEILKAK